MMSTAFLDDELDIERLLIEIGIGIWRYGGEGVSLLRRFYFFSSATQAVNKIARDRKQERKKDRQTRKPEHLLFYFP